MSDYDLMKVIAVQLTAIGFVVGFIVGAWSVSIPMQQECQEYGKTRVVDTWYECKVIDIGDWK